MENINCCSTLMQCSKYGMDAGEIGETSKDRKYDKDDADVDTVSMTVSETDGADGFAALDVETSSISTNLSSISKWENNPEKLIHSSRFTFMVIDKNKKKAENKKTVDEFPTENITFDPTDKDDDNLSLNSKESVVLERRCDDERFELLEDESLKLMIKEMQQSDIEKIKENTNIPKSIELSRTAEKDVDSIWAEVVQLPSKEAELKDELDRARLKPHVSSREIISFDESEVVRGMKMDRFNSEQTENIEKDNAENAQMSCHETLSAWFLELFCCVKT